MSSTILIADDSRLTRSLLKIALTSAGFDVVGEANTGKEAVDLFAQLKPNLVTMDLTMPVMDGMEASKEILRKDPHAKILMITSLGQTLIEAEFLKLGGCGMISKPFKNNEVVQKINDVLKNGA